MGDPPEGEPVAPFKAVLVDYDEDLFDPPDWLGAELSLAGIEWVAAGDWVAITRQVEQVLVWIQQTRE